MSSVSNREYCYYNFLITLSKLFEKEEQGYTWYDGPHLTKYSIFVDLYENYLDEVGKPYYGKSKTSNSDS